ncbi:MAG: coproporphyrinogen dehydrogenase HemZ, partial [Clostridia bacterium]|nr:coproporphyrinogen dehydrogenase HemZ [Clostridia bacterium]
DVYKRQLQDGMDKASAVQHLIRVSKMSPQKAELLADIAQIEENVVKARSNQVHLYVGIPFCSSRCLYCSFTAYPIQRYKSLVPDYIRALKKEVRHSAEWVKALGLEVGSVYIGGGTPTALDADSLAELLKALHEYFKLSGIEFTVEAGRPDTITIEKLKAIKDHKATRISINPQTMTAETLKRIGRQHSPEDIEDKFHMARALGFDNINMDIIAGLPQEDPSMFNHTLERIEALRPDSLTVHTMAVKRASRLKEELESCDTATDSEVDQMIEAARKSALGMGMQPYYLYRQKNILANLENTGYARPGLECLYNIQTMEETQSIIAMGAGAISKFVFQNENRIERAFNVKEINQYIDRIDEMLQRKEVLFKEYQKRYSE